MPQPRTQRVAIADEGFHRKRATHLLATSSQAKLRPTTGRCCQLVRLHPRRAGTGGDDLLSLKSRSASTVPRRDRSHCNLRSQSQFGALRLRLRLRSMSEDAARPDVNE
jgi:hypothetical protein